MQSNRYREELRDMTRAVLSGLEHAAAESSESESLLMRELLERVGDMRRLHEPVPVWATERLARVAEPTVASVIAVYREEVAGWPVPEGWIRVEDESQGDEGFGLALRRRDQVESALRIIMDWSLRRGRAPVQLAGWANLIRTLREWDEAVAKVVDRASAEKLLSLRATISESRGWLSRFPDSETHLGGGEEEAPTPLELDALGEPDDLVLNRYLSTGEMHGYIEGYASKSPEFAAVLEGTIEALLELGELGGALAPRRWLRRHRGATGQPLRYAQPPTRLAAADEDGNLQVHRIDLGAVPGLSGAANAELEVAADALVLRVHAGRGVLKRVQLDSVSTGAPEDTGEWIARCSIPSGPVRVQIEDRAGTVFEEQIEFNESS